MALQTASGDHLGFILFADEHVGAGDCIIRSLPREPALLDTKEYQFLCRYQDAGEFKFQFTPDKKELHIFKDILELSFQQSLPKERYAESKSGLSLFGLLIEEEEKS